MALSAVLISLLLRALPHEHYRLSAAWWDFCARAWPYEIPTPLVQVVDVDDSSLAIVGGRPWSRRTMAELLDRLREAGAAVVGFDLKFAGPARNGGTTTGAEIDERFAEAIRRMPVVIGFVMTDADGNGEVIRKAEFAFAGEFKVAKHLYNVQRFKPADHLHSFPGATVDFVQLQAAASGVGYANVHVDSDGVIRQVPVIAMLRDKPVPSFAAEVARVAKGGSSYFDSSDRYGLQEVRFAKIRVRTSRAGDVWLRYGPSRPERFIHAADLLAGHFDRERGAGRIVLVGVSAPSLGDQWPSPLGSTMPGVEILAQEVEQMLQGELLSRPDWVTGAEFLAALAASTLIVAFSSLGRAWAISTGSAAISLTVILSVFGYARWHVLIDPISPTLMLAMVTFGAALIQQRPRNGGQSA